MMIGKYASQQKVRENK